jgi:hypothetical protein
VSDERLEQLGIPRRAFLKKLAVGAFVAPAVVTFGLDGIAETATAGPGVCFANQAAAESQVLAAISIVNSAQSSQLVKPAVAKNLINLLDKSEDAIKQHNAKEACQRLWRLQTILVKKSGHGIAPATAQQVSLRVNNAVNDLDCTACF